MPTATTIPIAPGGIKSYYQAKIESSEILINQKTQNLRRLEAQRNALNARGQYYFTLRQISQTKGFEFL
jgi:26S proteasome regulatory subunit T6